MLRLIIWGFIFYFLFTLVKYVMRILSPGPNQKNDEIKNNSRSEKKFRIDDKDIVEADFTEIKDEEKKSEP